ncbi:MAG: D-alanine--D-alanine ligase, partial [Firmicutes bacterium]|nr:D-alanine--D-alanine ligase [Bacillota bacterium]
MVNKRVVGVLFGGQSSEHDISKISAATVISAIDKEKYFVVPIYIAPDGRWLLYDGLPDNITNGQWEKYAANAIISPDPQHGGLLRIVGDKIKKIQIDVVFPVLHGLGGEDGTVQGLLELAGIPYVGCGVLASAVSMNKAFTKIIAEKAGLKQAKYTVIYRNEITEKNIKKVCAKIEKAVGFPCFVKPANAGSSVGITKAHDIGELKEGIKLASEHDRTIIIEENINGRELECAVIGNDDVKASVVGEILPAADFYDFDAKYMSQESQTVVPADIDEKISDEIRKKAIKIFKALDGCGLARVDFFLEKETDRVIFNEINTMPGFTAISMYPMLWEYLGKEKDELMDELIELALTRND